MTGVLKIKGGILVLVRDMIAAQQLLRGGVTQFQCCHDFIRSGMDIIGTAKGHEECLSEFSQDVNGTIQFAIDKDLPYTKYRIT